MNLVTLSYNLNSKTPSYGGRNQVSIRHFEKIDEGSTANSYKINFYNHMGTHIDCPNHFYNSGKKISDFTINDLIFKNPEIIDVNLESKNEISLETINDNFSRDADIIFFRTFFSKKRNSRDYIYEYPFFSSELATNLINECPKLRAIGLDIISLTSPLNKDQGKKSHQVFLGNDKPVLIIEDMFLENYTTDINNIIVAPFFFDEIDSSPCSVYGLI